MAATTKIAKKACFMLESSGTNKQEWNGNDWNALNGTLEYQKCIFPYLSLGHKSKTNSEADNCISSNAFKDTPRQVGKYIEDSLSTYARYEGQGDFNYWAFGYEHAPVQVVLMTLEDVGFAEPSYGAVYTYTQAAVEYNITFIRRETKRDGTYWHVFRLDHLNGSVAPNTQTGALHRVSGSGVTDCTWTSCSEKFYEHTYELDSHNRHQTLYDTLDSIRYSSYNETSQLPGPYGWGNAYNVADVKCRRALIGVNLSTGTFGHLHAMCKKYGFKSDAGKMSELSADYVARHRSDMTNLGNGDSSGWGIRDTLVNNRLAIPHHDYRVYIGTNGSDLVPYGVSSIDLGIEIPLVIDQDTESGLYLAEPLFEGKYGASLGVTLSRHSSETFASRSDSWSDCTVVIDATSGYYRKAFFIENAKLPEAGPSDDDVAKEVLNFEIGYSKDSVFDTMLGGYQSVQNSPIILLQRNKDPYQYMNLIA